MSCHHPTSQTRLLGMHLSRLLRSPPADLPVVPQTASQTHEGSDFSQRGPGLREQSARGPVGLPFCPHSEGTLGLASVCFVRRARLCGRGSINK